MDRNNLLKNVTAYHPELPTVPDAISYLIGEDPACKAIWTAMIASTPMGGRKLNYADALGLMLLSVAFDRDIFKREAESMAQEQLADYRARHPPRVVPEPTATATHHGERTQGGGR